MANDKQKKRVKKNLTRILACVLAGLMVLGSVATIVYFLVESIIH